MPEGALIAVGAAGGPLILVVEHDPGVAELERRYLARAGFAVEVEPDPARAVAAVGLLRPAAVVLDLSSGALPAAVPPGELYRQVAEAARPAPVVTLIEPGEPLEAAEPAVPRPFAPRQLVDAVTEALHRPAAPPPHMLRAGVVTLDLGGRSAEVGERTITLTATEFDLLEYLMANPGRVFTREQLLQAVRRPGQPPAGGAPPGGRTIDVHVAQLRAKLGAASPIRTVRGIGYAVDP